MHGHSDLEEVYIKVDQTEIILAGSGGQGLLVSGIILGEAAILEGKKVIQTTSYGIAQRGGLSVAEVIISKDEILFQRVQEPNIILVLTDEAMERYGSLAGSERPVFYDTTLLKPCEGEGLYGFPFTGMADRLGHKELANTIAIGAMITKNHVVKAESMASVLKKRFSGKDADMNLKALKMGIDLISTYSTKGSSRIIVK